MFDGVVGSSVWNGRRTTSRLHLTQVSATLTLLSNCSCHQASYRPASSSSLLSSTLSSSSSSSSSWLSRLRVLSITGAAAGLGRLWIVWGAARKKWPKVEHVQRRRPRPSTPCRHLDRSSIIQGEGPRVFSSIFQFWVRCTVDLSSLQHHIKPQFGLTSLPHLTSL